MTAALAGNRIFLDIETLPITEDGWKQLPAKIREDLAKKPKKKDPGRTRQETARRGTSFLGDLGTILCIGVIVEQGGEAPEPVLLGWDQGRDCFREDEPALLREFWALLRSFDPQRDLLVGHNVLEFDLRLICQRSVVHKVRPTVDLSFRRYSNRPVFDTMQEWAKWSRQDRVSLDRLARALGLVPSKSEEMSGAQVYDRYLQGKHEMIRDYCLADVRLTREVYRRLTFAA